MQEKRTTERILLALPIRVSSYGDGEKGFSEDTLTIEINRTGARIALKHHVAPGDTIRIVNLENLREADFRVIGRSRLENASASDWGVLCLDTDRNLWDMHFSAPLETKDNAAGALLKCGDCGEQTFCALRDWEVEVLETGPLQRFCQECGGPTHWLHADADQHIGSMRPPETLVTPEPATVTPAAWALRRAYKRLALKLAILVRHENHGEEISKTENISKGGLAVGLSMKLEVGDVVTICCPYAEGGQNLEQQAEVRSRVTFFVGERWIYGLRYTATPS